VFSLPLEGMLAFCTAGLGQAPVSDPVQRAVDAITLGRAIPLGPMIERSVLTWADFRVAAAACTVHGLWRPAKKPVKYSTTDPIEIATSPGLLPEFYPSDVVIPAHTCSTSEFLPHEWLVHRVGPIRMMPPGANETPSSSSYAFTVEDAFDLTAVFQERNLGGVAVVAVASIPVNGNFEPIGFPPLHNHHSNIQSDLEGANSMQNLLVNHQDNTCASGHLECNMVSFPKGAGAWINNRLSFNGYFNDVRPAGSPPADVFIDAAIAIGAEATTQSVVQIRLDSASYGPPFFPHMPYFTLPIPAATPSVYWATWTVPMSGRALNIWLHTHEGLGYRETWVVEGSVDDLGLRALPWEGGVWGDNCSLVWVPAVPITSIKLSVLDVMAKRGLGIRCTGVRPASYSPSTGDVQTDWTCYEGADHMVKGDRLTNIAFYSPDSSDAHLHDTHTPQVPSVLQHHHMQSFIIPEEPASKTPFEVFHARMTTANPYLGADRLARESVLDFDLVNELTSECRTWTEAVTNKSQALFMGPAFGTSALANALARLVLATVALAAAARAAACLPLAAASLAFIATVAVAAAALPVAFTVAPLLSAPIPHIAVVLPLAAAAALILTAVALTLASAALALAAPALGAAALAAATCALTAAALAAAAAAALLATSSSSAAEATAVATGFAAVAAAAAAAAAAAKNLKQVKQQQRRQLNQPNQPCQQQQHQQELARADKKATAKLGSRCPYGAWAVLRPGFLFPSGYGRGFQRATGFDSDV